MFFNCGHIFAFMGTTFAFSDIYLHMKTHKKAQEGKVAENKQSLTLNNFFLLLTSAFLPSLCHVCLADKIIGKL